MPLHLSSFHLLDFLAQTLNTGNCRNNSNIGNLDCLPILFPDWEQYAREILEISSDCPSLSPEELADSIAWVRVLIFSMGKSITIGAFAYPTMICAIVINRIARA